MSQHDKPNDDTIEEISYTSEEPHVRGGSGSQLLQDVKTNKKALCYVLAVMTGVLLYGYDFVVVGTVSSLKSFQRDFGATLDGELIVPSLWLALWKAASPVGTMFGALLGGRVADRFGRRSSLATGVALATVGVAVFMTCHLPADILARRLIFTAAKFVQGIGIGMMLVFSQTYMSESVPVAVRAFAMSLIPFFTLLGQLIGAGVIASQAGRESNIAYLIPLVSQFAFTLLAAGAVVILPESPIWLIRRGRNGDAIASFRKLYPKTTDLDGLLHETEELVQREQNELGRISFLRLFQGTEQRRTLIVMIAYASPQLWGLTVLANASYFMQIVGMAELLSLVFLIIGIVIGIVANAASFYTIARFSRRRLILIGFGASTVVWMGIGAANCFVVNDVVIMYTAISLMVVLVINGLSSWPAYYIVGAEMSSLPLRALSQSIGWFGGSLTTAIFNIAMPYIYNPGSGDLRGKTGFVYGGCCVIMLALSWLLVPEIKGRTPEDVDRLFELRVSSRKFDRFDLPQRVVPI